MLLGDDQMEMKKTPSGVDGKKQTNAVTGIVQDVNRKGVSERDVKKKNENMKHINSVLDKDQGNTFKLEESRGIDEPKKTTYIPRQPAVEYLLKIEQQAKARIEKYKQYSLNLKEKYQDFEKESEKYYGEILRQHKTEAQTQIREKELMLKQLQEQKEQNEVAIKELQDKITFAEEKGFKFEEEEEEVKDDEDKLSEDESNIDPNSEVLVENFNEVKEDRNKLKQKITTWMNNYRHLNNKEPDENDKLEIKQLLDDYEHINKKYARMKFKLTKEGQIEEKFDKQWNAQLVAKVQGALKTGIAQNMRSTFSKGFGAAAMNKTLGGFGANQAAIPRDGIAGGDPSLKRLKEEIVEKEKQNEDLTDEIERLRQMITNQMSENEIVAALQEENKIKQDLVAERDDRIEELINEKGLLEQDKIDLTKQLDEAKTAALLKRRQSMIRPDSNAGSRRVGDQSALDQSNMVDATKLQEQEDQNKEIKQLLEDTKEDNNQLKQQILMLTQKNTDAEKQVLELQKLAFGSGDDEDIDIDGDDGDEAKENLDKKDTFQQQVEEDQKEEDKDSFQDDDEPDQDTESEEEEDDDDSQDEDKKEEEQEEEEKVVEKSASVTEIKQVEEKQEDGTVVTKEVEVVEKQIEEKQEDGTVVTKTEIVEQPVGTQQKKEEEKKAVEEEKQKVKEEKAKAKEEKAKAKEEKKVAKQEAKQAKAVTKKKTDAKSPVQKTETKKSNVTSPKMNANVTMTSGFTNTNQKARYMQQDSNNPAKELLQLKKKHAAEIKFIKQQGANSLKEQKHHIQVMEEKIKKSEHRMQELTEEVKKHKEEARKAKAHGGDHGQNTSGGAGGNFSNEERQQMQDEIDEMHQLLDRFEKDVEEKIKKIQHLEKSKELMIQSYETQLEEVEDQLKKLGQEQDDIQAQHEQEIEKKNIEIQQLKLKGDNSAAEQIKEFKSKIEELKKQQTAELKAKQDEISEQQEKAKELGGKIKGLNEEIKELQDQVQKRDKEIQKQEKKMKDLGEAAEKSAELAEQNVALKKTTKQLNKDLTDVQDKYKAEQVKRKGLLNELEDLKGKIRVYCRIRPLSRTEKADEERSKICCNVIDEFQLTVGEKYPKTYNFDTVFGMDTTQEQVFEDTKRLVQSAIDGYNVCIFAYGQTGSGKTFTIQGDEANPGLTPRTIHEMFDIIGTMTNYEVKVTCYMVEIYKGDLNDLLLEKGAEKVPIEIKESPTGMVVLKNANIHDINSIEEAESTFAYGMDHRKVRKTLMNDASSRSHLIFAMIIDATNKNTKQHTIGKLSFVDLAGSESQKKTGTTKEGQEEANAINQSLSALGNVITALSDGSKHIPYRNHILTKVMKDSLGGTAKTLMFVNCSPSAYNDSETKNSLEYATRVKKIKNTVNKNVESKETGLLKKHIVKVEDRYDQLVNLLKASNQVDELNKLLAEHKAEDEKE